MSAHISNITIFEPPNQLDQDSLALWMAKVQSLAAPNTFDEKLIQKFSVNKSYIQKRSFFSSDIGSSDFANNHLFKEENSFSPSLKERSAFYQNTVENVFNVFFEDKQDSPDEILHVTCTGYVSPSAGQKVISKNLWSDTTGMTHMYHMGCYAAMPAIKVAKGMSDKNRIDIVHTEICSNHFDVHAQSAEQTVVQTLFADGAIKYSVNPNGSNNEPGISVLKMKEAIIPYSEKAMTWGFGENNFEMTLHRSVPSLIKKNLKEYVLTLYKESGMDFQKDKTKTIFAIHPGGPQIIEQIKELLELSDHQVEYSTAVLKERGNMSSATLPHVWKKIVKDPAVQKGTPIVSLAFGPGLTVAGFMGEKT